MIKIKIWGDDLDHRQLDTIVETLKSGELIIIPTDTIYAICCDSLNRKAIDALCRLKGINPDKTQLSIICNDLSMSAEYAKFDNAAFRLIRDNTPGAFTFICKAANALPPEFKRRKTVGIRIPDFKATRQIAEALGHPLLTTTIEYSDSDYAINPELIAEAYQNRVALMLEGPDGGETPSTIIDCSTSTPEIIREGAGILL